MSSSHDILSGFNSRGDRNSFSGYNEDSPPGLTASGSSDDDGSSPSSLADGQTTQQSARSVASSSKAGTESSFDPMSPWTQASDSYDGSHRRTGSTSVGDDMEWHSPSLSSNGDQSSFARLASSSGLDGFTIGNQHNFSMISSPSLTSSSPGIAAPDDAQAKQELRAASQRMAAGNRDFGVSNAMSGWGDVRTNANDEQMFDSIIEEDSFGPPSTRTSAYAGSPNPRSARLSSAFGALQIPNGGISPPQTSASTLPTSTNGFQIKSEGGDFSQVPSMQASSSSNVASQSMTPAHFTAPNSHFPSRRGSMEGAKAAMLDAVSRDVGLEAADQNLNNAEGEVAFSASTVVRPDGDTLSGLQIHVHGIAARGAKSRVETQIKAHLELVRPVSEEAGPSTSRDSNSGVAAWERIGSYSHLKLPPLSATKRKTKKNQQGFGDVPKEQTLYLDVAVVNASPPHERAYACNSCAERERKRAERRKSGKAKSGPVPTEEEMRKLGVDPADPRAAQIALERLTQEESKRIILFNCGDYVEFKDGHAELPTRITCYCRHHKEKLGFCILFTMRNWKGRTVACGSTPAIMITDDHKSSAAIEKFKRDAVNGAASVNGEADGPSQPSSVRGRSTFSADRSRANSSEVVDGQPGASRNKAKKSRSKPYDAPSSRRGTVSNGSNSHAGLPMSAMGSNHGGSPDPQQQSQAPPMDLVQALAAIGNERAMNQMQAQAASSSAPGHGATAPVSAQALHAFGNLLSEGSISPDTLATNPMSLPNFDLSNSVIAQQMLALFGQQPYVDATAGGGFPPLGTAPMQSSVPEPAPPAFPQATISKVIPGEGPTSGGMEVTVLGDNFREGLTCFFGDLAATSTRVWAANTLICVLPPSPSPGPVAVTVKSAQEAHHSSAQAGIGSLQLFTYVDKSDTQLMELALQVVGFQQTRTMQVPRDVALRLLASGQGSINSNVAAQQHHHSGQQYSLSQDDPSNARAAVQGLFAAAAWSRDGQGSTFQDTVIGFLGRLESEDASSNPRLDAVRLANANGHTLLHLAVMLGFHRLASKLIALGCPIDARDRNGLTALHLAALNGRAAIARVLLSHGARSDLRGWSSQAPIDFAVSQDYTELEEMLSVSSAGTGAERSRSVDSSTWAGDDDGSGIDDDNLSTSLDDDEDDEEAWEDEDDVDGPVDGVTGETLGADNVTPRPPATPIEADAKLPLPLTPATYKPKPLDGESKLNDKSAKQDGFPSPSDEKHLMPTSLRSLATKLPGGLAFLNHTERLLPHGLQQRMQAVPVFQMTMPSSPALNWTNFMFNPSARGDVDKDGKASRSAGTSASDDEAEDSSRIATLWRHLIEETGMWMAAMQQQQLPPPAYEETTTTKKKEEDAVPSASSGVSRSAMSTPEPSNIIGEASTGSQTSRRKRTSSSLSRRAPRSSRSVTHPSADDSTDDGAAVSTNNSSSTASKRRLDVSDDWMLRWFWLPCLFLAALVALLTSGPLSLSGLASYLPPFVAGSGSVVRGAGGPAAAGALAANRH